MTSPDFFDPEQMPDAINAGSGFSGATSTSPSQHLQQQLNQIGGPLGDVIGWALDGLADDLIGDAESIGVPGRVPTLENAAELLFGRVGSLVGQITKPIEDLLDAFLGDYEGSDPILQAIQSWASLFGDLNWTELQAAFGGTYAGDDPALQTIQTVIRSLSGLFGLVGRPRLVSLGDLIQPAKNLLADGGFDHVESVVAGEGWSWNAEIGRTTPYGTLMFDAAGQAGGTVLCDPAIEVVEGKEVVAEVWARWWGLTHAGGPVITPTLRWLNSAGGLVATSPLTVVSAPAGTAPSWTKLDVTATAPAGAAECRLALTVTAAVSAGIVRFDDARVAFTATSLPQTWITGLTAALQNLGEWIEGLVDQLLGALGVPSLGSLFDKITDLSDEIGDWLGSTEDHAATLFNLIGDTAALRDGVVQALTGVGDAIDQTLSDVMHALRNIMPSNILGSLGLPSLDDVIDHVVGLIAEGFGIPGLLGSLPGIGAAGQNVSQQASTALQVGTANQHALAVRDDRPMYIGLDPTTEASFPITDIPATSGEPTSRSGSSLIGFVRCQRDGDKGFVEWYGNGAVSNLYVNIYRPSVGGEMRYGITPLSIASTMTGIAGYSPPDYPTTNDQSVFAVETPPQGGGGEPGVFTSAQNSSRIGFTGIQHPRGVAMNATHTFVADNHSSGARVLKAPTNTTPGSQEVIPFSGLTYVIGVALHPITDAVYVVDAGTSKVFKYEGGVQTEIGFTGLSNPYGLDVDHSGAVFVTDYGNDRVVKFADGVQTVLDIPGLSQPTDVCVWRTATGGTTDELVVTQANGPALHYTPTSIRKMGADSAFSGAVSVAAFGTVALVVRYGTSTNSYLAIGKTTASEGSLVKVANSENRGSYTAAGWGWYRWNMPEPVTVKAGDALAVEIRAYGGTHKVASLDRSWIANHPTALVKNLGAGRTTSGDSPEIVTPGNIVWTGNAPWVGIGIASDNYPVQFRPPAATTVTNTGSGTYTVPDWFVLGRDKLLVVALGAGGGNGTAIESGGAGGPTTFTDGWTRTANGGAGGGAGTTGDPTGGSPGNYTASAQRFFGGTIAAARNGGSAPGGGAGGGGAWPLWTKPGNAGSWASELISPSARTVAFSVGGGGDSKALGVGDGARGQIWFVAIQGGA